MLCRQSARVVLIIQQYREQDIQINLITRSNTESKTPLPEMVLEPIDETDESTTTTTSSEVNQLIQQVQQELEVEDKRHYNTLAYYKSRIQEEEEKHSKQHGLLEAKLLQAIAQTEGGIADNDYWLNNKKIPKKEKPKKPTKAEKTLIRAQVKKAYTASKKK